MDEPAVRPPMPRPSEREAVEAEGIPLELDRFLRKSPHPWVLIRGPAGSGKTVLAARLLSRIKGPKVWVQTRPGSHGIDPRTPELPGIRPEELRAVDVSPATMHADRHGSRLHQALQRLTSPPGDETDDDGGWLPPGLDVVWRELEDAEDCGIVLDTWDGLLDLYRDADARSPITQETLQRLLLGRLGQRPRALILVGEPGGAASVEHVVDAVLQTAVGEIEERAIRVMTIPKLRGVALEETVFPYTLDGGVFRHLPRSLLDIQGVGSGTDLDPAPDARTLWPGSVAYAEAFGRWPTGRASLLEREESVPVEIVLTIATAAAIGTLRRGGRVLLIPPIGVSPERILAIYGRAVPYEVLTRSLRILTLPASDPGPAEVRPILLHLQPPGHEDVPMLPYGVSPEEEALEPISAEATAFVDGSAGDPHPALVVADMPGFLHAITTVGRTPTPQLIAATLRRLLERRTLHILGTGVLDEPILDPFRNLARPQVRLVTRRGRVFALGYRPWTPAYVVLPAPFRSEGPAYSLLRVS